MKRVRHFYSITNIIGNHFKIDRFESKRERDAFINAMNQTGYNINPGKKRKISHTINVKRLIRMGIGPWWTKCNCDEFPTHETYYKHIQRSNIQ